MSGNLTFTIIKPDAVRNGHTGKIIDQIIEAGFKVRAMKMVWLSDKTAGDFYAIHRERPFFKDLVEFMTSGPCVPAILEKDNAVEDFRTLIGSTNPAAAAPGTIRNRFAKSIDANAIHGSDSDENALREGGFFFSEMETF
ncbi:MAG: nucleoside-diphosphate kinase [Bacteroidia bacterium]